MITNKQVRDNLGHNGCECRVRITRDGRVLRYGSPEPTDRSRDYWSYMGTDAEVKAEMSARAERMEA